MYQVSDSGMYHVMYHDDPLGHSQPYCGGCLKLGPYLADAVKMAPRIFIC